MKRRVVGGLVVLVDAALMVILSALFDVSLENTWLSFIGVLVAGITFLVIIFLDLKLIIMKLIKNIHAFKENKDSRARRSNSIVYAGIIIGELVLISIISKLTGVSTQNTWLGVVGIDLVFITTMVMSFKKAKALANENENKRAYLYLATFIGFAILLIANVMFLVLSSPT